MFPLLFVCLFVCHWSGTEYSRPSPQTLSIYFRILISKYKFRHLTILGISPQQWMSKGSSHQELLTYQELGICIFSNDARHSSLQHFILINDRILESKGGSLLPYSSLSSSWYTPPGQELGQDPPPENLAWPCNFLRSVDMAEFICKSEPEPRATGVWGCYCSPKDSKPQRDLAQLRC